MQTIQYRVKTFRDAGLEAKWGKTRRGQPALFVRNPKATTKHQREQWWLASNAMIECMKTSGVLEGFDNATMLGNFFSVPA